MYHPAEDPNAEFIELTNVGAETINLNLVRFTKGIEYLFAAEFASLPREAIACWSRISPAFEATLRQGLPWWANIPAA